MAKLKEEPIVSAPKEQLEEELSSLMDEVYQLFLQAKLDEFTTHDFTIKRVSQNNELFLDITFKDKTNYDLLHSILEYASEEPKSSP